MKKCDLFVVLMGDFSKVVFSFLIIGMFFYSTLLNAQSGKNAPNTPPSKSSTLEIISPTTGEKLEVAVADFTITIISTDALSIVRELGNGWRLPTYNELKLMYEELYLKGFGNFQTGYYTTLECNNGTCVVLNFEDGKQSVGKNSSDWTFTKHYIRIRTVRPKSVIK
jgi:hypothetical protein